MLLFALLIGMQTISAAHAYEHDPASLGDTTCATCISVNQLAAVAIDSGHVLTPIVPAPVYHNLACDFVSAPPFGEHRQRGPPRSS